MTRLTGDVGDLTSQIATMDDAGVQSSISKQLIPSLHLHEKVTRRACQWS
jgi:hypothetical protein